MNLPDRARDLRRRDTVTDTPASDGISFRHRVDYDSSLAHPVELGHRDVFDLCAVTRIKNVLVDLVSEAKRVKLLAKPGNEFHLTAGKNFACRIIRIADDDGFRLFVERRF